MKRVAIVDGSSAYRHLFTKLGYQVVLSLEDADLVCFTGGEDVTPSLYGAEPHRSTYNSLYRDQREKEAYEIAQGLNIPVVGICRGGQFLNVMNGGMMYQDVGDHTRAHYLTDLETGEKILVTSTHHQMMFPANNAIILATANEKGFREWYDPKNKCWVSEAESDTDYEVLFYADTKSLCFQPHPEFFTYGEEYLPMVNLFDNYLKTYCFEEIAA